MFCSTCGSALTELSKFCGSCGAKQGQTTQPIIKGARLEQFSSSKSSGTKPHPALRTLFVTTHGFAGTLSKLLSEVGGFTSNVISTPGNSRDDLAKLCKKYLDQFDSLCLVGGFGDISPFQVTNPSAGSGDPDEWCFTDALFACPEFDEDDVESAIPKVGVSRIPTLNNDTVQKLLSTIELDGNLRDQFCFGVTAELWEPATARIFKEAGLNADALFSAPDWDEIPISKKINENEFTDKARVYLFNVHGGSDSTEWVGDGQENRFEPTVLSPNALQSMSNSLLISEACYGGAMEYDEPSIVEQFFESDGKAFVGCSVVAYGNPGAEDMPLFSADIIALSLLRKLSEGLSLSESLREAKKETLEEAIGACESDPGLDIETFGSYASKAILSFNAFGCPWLRFSKASIGALGSGIATTPTSSTTDRVNDLRSRLNSRIQARTQRISQRLTPLRESYRARLPLKSQLFLMSSDESLAALRSFRDAARIEGFLAKKKLKFSNCNLFKTKSTSSNGYLICASSKPKDNNYTENLALVTNNNGELKFILCSK